MAYDGIAVACMVRELSEKLCGGRIDKITQPQWDEINITIRNNGKNHKLLVSASTSFARCILPGAKKIRKGSYVLYAAAKTFNRRENPPLYQPILNVL